MQRIALAIFALALSVASACAQTVTGPIPNSGVYGAYNAAPPTCIAGSGCWFQTDVNGNVKVNIAAGGGAGGTASTFGAAFPATGTAVGMSQGGNMVAMNGLAGNLLVNCNVGCSGGTFNNNADNVATSATNGQSASWLYVWDGATWDRLYGDSTNGAKVNVTNTLAAIGNNADAVAAGAGAASPVGSYNYVWNGATWDRMAGGTAGSKVTPQAIATGGATTFKLIAAATNNSTLISAGVHTIYSYQTSSISASTPYWLKFYDKATAPTCGTDVPVKVILIPPTNSGNNGNIPVGFAVALGLGICVVGGITDADNTSAAATTIAINIDYK